MRIEDFLARLQGVKPTGDNQWQAQCPAQCTLDDELTLTVILDNDTIKPLCKNGCSLSKIAKAVELKARDFIPRHDIPEEIVIEQSPPPPSDDKPKSTREDVDTITAMAGDFLYRPEYCDLENNMGALKLRYWRNTWWKYNGKYYSEYPTSDLEAKISAFINSRACKEIKPTTTLRRNIVAWLEGQCHIEHHIQPPIYIGPPQFHPKGADLVVVNNGLLSLDAFINSDDGYSYTPPNGITRFVLNPFTPDYFAISGLPTDYNNDAACPKWTAWLEEILPDHQLRFILKMMFGYGLVPDQRSQRFFVLSGEAGTGKSTVLEVLNQMIGPDGFSSVPYEGFSDKFSLAQVVGKFFNIADDIDQGDQVAELKLKQYIGGLPIQVERKNKDPFKIIPSAKLVFSSNSPPRFRDKSEGVWRKLIIVPFEHVIPEKDRIPEYAKTNIFPEIEGIFRWALSGYMDLYDLLWRFPEPPACLAAKDEHRADSSSAYAFLSETYEKSEIGDISAGVIYEKYVEYCRENGIRKPVSANILGKEIKRRFGDVRERGSDRASRKYFYKLKVVN